jgi:hypothetical protein
MGLCVMQSTPCQFFQAGVIKKELPKKLSINNAEAENQSKQYVLTFGTVPLNLTETQLIYILKYPNENCPIRPSRKLYRSKINQDAYKIYVNDHTGPPAVVL